MPAGEDDDLLRIVVETSPNHGRVPLPSLLPDEFGVGLVEVLVHIIEDGDVHGLASERAVPTDRPDEAGVADRLGYLRVALVHIVQTHLSVVEEGVGEDGLVGLRVHYPLDIPVEGLGLVGGVRADDDLQVRVQPEQEGREKSGRSLALPVLGRDGDDETLDLAVGEPVQGLVVHLVEVGDVHLGHHIPGEGDEPLPGNEPNHALRVRSDRLQGLLVHHCSSMTMSARWESCNWSAMSDRAERSTLLNW